MCIRDRYQRRVHGDSHYTFLPIMSGLHHRDYDYLFKLVIVGNSGVGKSSLLLRFADDSFSETYLTTIGVDFRFRTLKIDQSSVKLQIWDTAGQERFRTITNAYYKGADGIVIVYDTTNHASFEDVERYWLNEVESYSEKNVEMALLGNKSDMGEGKAVTYDEAKDFARKKKMHFFEVSAKTSDNVTEAFVTISKKLIESKEKEKERDRESARNQKTTVSKLTTPASSLNGGSTPDERGDTKKGGCCQFPQRLNESLVDEHSLYILIILPMSIMPTWTRTKSS
eukprot:TRINITY_DN7158_c0_g1_i6.p1 TRINITY_DN7158_c0_g1~~TRINITY_DN7158_c0_g1_i6.p1  ORF type:complete len:283 (-),score=46.93 TRINITY_DN7158_c0_g1_i6:128-976(-)